MTITKEQVSEEAKRLGLTLDESKINAYVTLGVLPTKGGTVPPSGDEDEDDDENKDLTRGMQDRLRKEKEKRLAIKAQLDANLKKLKELEEMEALKSAEKDKEKGNWEKLSKEALDAKAKADAIAVAAKDKFKATAIRSRLETELLKAGVPADRLSKAVKLFDSSKIDFSWSKEDALEFEIEELGSEIEVFKKENYFLFVKTGDGDDAKTGYQGFNYNQNNNKKGKDKKLDELKSMFRSLQ